MFSPQRHREHRVELISGESATGSESLRLGEETTILLKNSGPLAENNKHETDCFLFVGTSPSTGSGRTVLTDHGELVEPCDLCDSVVR